MPRTHLLSPGVGGILNDYVMRLPIVEAGDDGLETVDGFDYRPTDWRISRFAWSRSNRAMLITRW
jgi:hypothetical protein